jgi:hypothetical protein
MTYRIKIARGDIHFEVEGDKKFVLEMLAKYGDMTTLSPHPRETLSRTGKTPPPPLIPSTSKKLSLGEFIRQLGYKKHTEMVLAFGYFLEKVSGLASFTAADINTCYYEAKLESSNTSQMIIQNIRSGRMMPAKKGKDKEKKAYVLTRSGEEFIEKKLPKSAM